MMAAENNELQSLLGKIVGGLKIESLLGQGGMGAVFLARQVELGVPRALKVIRADILDNEEIKQRFRREAQTLSRLQHHGIVQVMDFGHLDNGWLYMVMEYVEGHDLARQVDTRGPMDLSSALVVLQQVAAALQFAHSQSVAHRDLKPENLVLRHGDPSQVKIIDFGLAKLIGDEARTRLTEEGQVLGSPLYMAPEQAGLGDVGAPADLYALAGIAYYLLSGQAIFPEHQFERVLELVVAHCNRQPIRLSDRLSPEQSPPALDALLLACLDKKPENRPNARDALEALERLHLEVRASATGMLSAAPPAPAPAPEPTPPTPAPAARRTLSDILYASDGTGRVSPLLDAILNQLTAIMMDLASELSSHVPADSPLHHHLAGLSQIDEEIESVELDRALLESAVSNPGASQEERTNYGALVARVTRLEDAARRHRKRLFDVVMQARSTVKHPNVAGLSDEFEALLGRYQEARHQEIG